MRYPKIQSASSLNELHSNPQIPNFQIFIQSANTVAIINVGWWEEPAAKPQPAAQSLSPGPLRFSVYEKTHFPVVFLIFISRFISMLMSFCWLHLCFLIPFTVLSGKKQCLWMMMMTVMKKFLDLISILHLLLFKVFLFNRDFEHLFFFFLWKNEYFTSGKFCARTNDLK